MGASDKIGEGGVTRAIRTRLPSRVFLLPDSAGTSPENHEGELAARTEQLSGELQCESRENPMLSSWGVAGGAGVIALAQPKEKPVARRKYEQRTYIEPVRGGFPWGKLILIIIFVLIVIAVI